VQERIIRNSKLDWVIVRPVILTDGPKTNAYRAFVDPRDWTCGFISRVDVADFLVKQIDDDAFLRKTPVLAPSAAFSWARLRKISDIRRFGAGRAPLFRRRGLFGRRSFDVARFALLISFAQELVNHARASLLLDPSLLRFLLFSEELVIYFPAHCVLHRDRTNGMTTPQYRPQFQFLTSRSPPSKPSIIRLEAQCRRQSNGGQP
jgi:NAD(P)H-binding